MTIAEIDPLYVEVFIPVSEYRTVQPGMPANVSPELPIGGNFDAKVAVVDNVLTLQAAPSACVLYCQTPTMRCRLVCDAQFVSCKLIAIPNNH